MSGHVNQKQEKADRKRALKQEKLPWATEDAEVGECAWEEVEANLVAYAVYAVDGVGASIQFTCSRDRGALGVRVYDEAVVSKTEWGRPNDDIEDLLYRIGDYYREKAGKEKQRW